MQMRIEEFPLPDRESGPYGIALGIDGTLWFTENKGNRIGRITVTGEIKEYAVPTDAAGLSGIASGTDGDIWFTEHEANQIGKIIE